MDIQTYINNRTITVGELKSLLNNFEDETPVMFSYDYGDHWHSQVAEGFKEPEILNVQYSDYHNKPKLDIPEDTDQDRYDDQKPFALIFRS